MNTRMLKQIKEQILEEPRRVDMGIWAADASSWIWDDAKAPACGTVGCIAGWAVALKTRKRGTDLTGAGHFWEMEAIGILGLDDEQAKRLFLPDFWPEKFQKRLNKFSPQTKRYAKVVADRIDHFIATKGAE